MKTVLITGATSGYGLETARVFQRNGYAVLIASRNPDKVAAVTAAEGFAAGYTLDVTDYEGWLLPGQASTGFQRGAGIGEVTESLHAADIANAVWYCASQPREVVVEEVTVWGTSQDVQPL